jgi:RNA polymerase sigma-70 factor (ECF subfamily)
VLILKLKAEPPPPAPPDPGVSEEELLLRAEAGDAAAVGILFDRFADLILGIGLRVLRDRGEAEDLVQDFFLNLFHKIKGFDPMKGSARTWMIQIAYRRAFDRRGYLSKREFYSGTELESLENTLVEDEQLAAQIIDWVTGEQLHAAFQELAERHQATLEMYFFEGLDLREISERLGESRENTRHFSIAA